MADSLHALQPADGDLIRLAGEGDRNAFDQLYFLADGFPEPGRRFFLTARLRT